jgi:hypothetical protein
LGKTKIKGYLNTLEFSMKMENFQKHRGGLPISRTKLIVCLWIIIFLSFPKGIKATGKDFVETLSTLILLLVALVFLCAAIGLYSRRYSNSGSGGYSK